MKEKLKNITKINDDIEYLRDEYESSKLWGSCPDGDVKFDDLLKWLTENKYNVEHMIKIGELINDLTK